MVKKPRLLMMMVALLGSAQLAAAQSAPGPYDAVHHADWLAAGLQAGPESSPYRSLDPADGGFRHAKFERMAELPPDPYGPERLYQPTPLNMPQFKTGHPVALNTRSDPATLGIRLDETYGILRDAWTVHSFSELQIINGGGMTFLPLQTPCWVVGVRGTGYLANNRYLEDEGAFSWDVFAGTRYKTLYLKGGPFWDYQDTVGKVGFTFGALAKVPALGYFTLDHSLGFRTNGDIFGPDRSPRNLRLIRTESADTDWQIRIGRFFGPNWQLGASWVYRTFDFEEDQWGIGPFANVYCGRFKIGGELTSGNENVRGMVTISFAFGAPPDLHRRDARLINVDTVAWVTQAVERDLVVQKRRTFTGPLPPGP